MTRLADAPVSRLYADAASTAPAPGGGAVTALTGALGIALILKALRISARKLDDPSRISPGERALEDVAARLVSGADADSAGFEAYIAASRMPRESEAQKMERTAALSRAAIEAAGAALTTLEAGAAGLKLAREVEPLIAKNIIEDLMAGRELLRVTCAVAMANARANFGAIKDQDEKARAESRLATVRGDIS
jgi:methenyltetrahydrofolate cyclohydrolase